jgi:hypothetical protein
MMSNSNTYFKAAALQNSIEFEMNYRKLVSCCAINVGFTTPREEFRAKRQRIMNVERDSHA